MLDQLKDAEFVIAVNAKLILPGALKAWRGDTAGAGL